MARKFTCWTCVHFRPAFLLLGRDENMFEKTQEDVLILESDEVDHPVEFTLFRLSPDFVLSAA